MTLTIELSPEEETLLRNQAQQRGQAVADEARSLVRAGLKPEPEAGISEEAHQQLTQRLLAVGLMTELPTHPGQTTPFQPIVVLGLPVSQTLLEDRE